MEQRTEIPKELEKVGGPAPLDWLAEYTEKDSSTDAMQEYRILPRIKQIQGTTAEDLKEQFGEGSAIIVPGNVALCPRNGSFTFVPVFFWTEFWQTANLKDKVSPMIMVRTEDKTSAIASASRDPERREFLYKNSEGAEYKGKNSEVLLFAIIIADPTHPLNSVGCVMSFVRGEFSVGRNFINAIGMRKVPTANGPRQAPLWSTRWTAMPSRREKSADQKWWGMDIVNAAQPSIAPDEAMFYRAMHDELKAFHLKKQLGVDTTDMESEVTEPTDSTAF